MRLMIATGGTGGHIYAARGMVDQLKARCPVDCLFVGGKLKQNAYLDALHVEEVACSPIDLRKWWRLPKAIWNILRGMRQTEKQIEQFRPDAIVGFGSYYTLPILLAAIRKKVPLILHEQNRVPGKVNRLFSPYAIFTGVCFPDTPLKGTTLFVDYPLREGMQTVSKKVAREHFNLDADALTILVFGGSQGAKRLNEIVAKVLSKMPHQVIHLIGKDETFQNIYTSQACVKPFEKEMHLAWAAADVVICRSGAGTLAEQLHYTVPGILVPYPYASEQHQLHNARFMEETVGLAKVIEENQLTEERLQTALDHLFKTRLKRISEANEYKQKHRPKPFVEQLMEVIK
ncbi:MAG: UDP-N-acetylglucosamine--N-acetylmuramyl-(pentapeptide) pyrophosphoryl-undecaprenol N-acetylglucosamine transferase [Chlamydiia bacterium]|nr:UDP-N-acetylglucosamine--N-acetylmuramyl-(pentapeptide) pyrophosphoryl-undecaprenol N-acetylglucosamine transferase [Chlamydiia bacterium]